MCTTHKIMAYLTFLGFLLDISVAMLFLASIRAIRDYRRRGGLTYPPGPRPLPIVGNLFDIPGDSSWLAYTQFSKSYGNSLSFWESILTRNVGDIMSFRVFGQVVVVLNSIKVAKDLLEKNADIYSDRPVIPFYEM
jgi:hypothetical protein